MWWRSSGGGRWRWTRLWNGADRVWSHAQEGSGPGRLVVPHPARRWIAIAIGGETVVNSWIPMVTRLASTSLRSVPFVRWRRWSYGKNLTIQRVIG
jgi:hypothetical protein